MLIVGIAGGTGSGKTTVVKKILKKLGKDVAVVLPQDAYYKDASHLPMEERLEMNFDHPNSVEFDLLIEHLEKLKNGESIEQPKYSYVTCERLNETTTILPQKVIIVEGILVLTSEKLRDLLDIKVFVYADADDRLTRVIKRDMIERERSVERVLERYDKWVKPMHLQFIEPTMRYANIIVPHGGDNHVAIDVLVNFIQNKLKNA